MVLEKSLESPLDCKQSILKEISPGCSLEELMLNFQLALEKTLEIPLDCKEIQPVHPKEISADYSLEGLMLELKLKYFGYLMQRTDSFEKPLMLGEIEGRRRRG